MSLIHPFAGLRPVDSRAGDVLAPPYDVLSSAEARVRAQGRPWSFLHISRAEIDLPEATDPHDPMVYRTAAANLRRMIDAAVLQRDGQPCYYAYRLAMGQHVQTGLVVAASVAAYNSNRIRKHEFTRPDKEDDRVHQIEALNAQTGPVLLASPPNREIEDMLVEITRTTPEVDLLADDGIGHSFWTVCDPAQIDRITALYEALPALYIADGHHRSAAASRVAAARPGDERAASFLAVIFPAGQMQILDYNRVVRDLAGHTPESLLAEMSGKFTVHPVSAAVHPQQPGEFGMYLAGQWYQLRINPDLIPADPVARLDVSLLADHLLAPLLGITDPRRDSRIDFVGGIRGLGELERRVDSGEMAIAFALHPTGMRDLMAVADAGEVMPPKSTWFEPKLADGLVSLVLD